MMPILVLPGMSKLGIGYQSNSQKIGPVMPIRMQSGRSTDGDQNVATYQLDKSDLFDLTFSKSTALLTVVVGQDGSLVSRIKSSIAAESLGDDTLTVSLPSFSELPIDAIGWQSVNRLIISTASVEDIADADPRVFDAMLQWVKSGGDLILIGDPTRIELFENDGSLAQLLPGKIRRLVQMTNSRDLERFVGTSKKQLIGRDDDPMPMLEAVPSTNATVVATVDDRPVLIRASKGFGRLSFCALNLESDRLVKWPSHSALVEKIIATNDKSKPQQARSESKRPTAGLTHSGYTDLLGQLRVPLDDFSTVRFLPFTLIAFFLKNVLKKMELTWITFPLLALLFCGLAFAISFATRPSELQVNQMEIIDFDLVDGASRGTAWVNLYAPTGEKVDVAIESETSFGLNISQQVVSWQGLPGDGLGGMENEVSTGFKKLPYQQTISPLDAGDLDISLEQLPLQVASTKPLLINFKIANPDNFSSQLSQKRNRLEGTFKNPLDVPVYNGKIFFRAANGGTGNEAGRSQNRPWDPNEKNLTRIADVMMFYEVAGGQAYTGLSNGYHREIDFSRLLRLGQAVLVGQTENGSRIKINGQDVSDRYDSNITMVRMVLPVTNN